MYSYAIYNYTYVHVSSQCGKLATYSCLTDKETKNQRSKIICLKLSYSR